ncbi:glycosyltransferase family 61 protein [Halomonas korlensis]|uniref:Glycosyltransferase 61 catalytic domain-containing protein n=1 Tax=Halomonas korlensis TaxID=463301 RepID=A0A1I7F8D1_9GAMM|nr:glycosyltransferase family 61 protein [Halomonas korlensis]SFU32432.1 Protein of unknown function [Halomonas korlensis]
MAKPLNKLLKNVVRKLIKAPLRKLPIVLEHAWFVSPKKTKFAVWYKDEILEDKDAPSTCVATCDKKYNPLDWIQISKVKFSGVCVLSNGMLLMCRPLKVHQRHPESRKAIVCTRNYRPLKYPGAQSLLFSLTFIRRNLAYWLKTEEHRSLSGNIALLGNSVFDNANYYHFWTDVIADIWYIRQHLPEAELPDYYLVPLSNAAWQWDVLSMCGVHESQVIPYARHEVVSLDKLTIPIRDKGAVNLPSWLCRAMHDMSGWSPKPQRGERLIFVSRADADRRRVVNERVIREHLSDRGFEVHTLNGLSVTKQQQLFASAAIICAPHGAALTNLVWCSSGTVIIDLLSERHLIPCFRDLAAQNQLFYYPFACQQVEGVTSGIKGDIVVSDAQVDSVLDIIDQHVPRCGDRISAQIEKTLSDKSTPIS